MSPAAEITGATPGQEVKLNGHGNMENGDADALRKAHEDKQNGSGNLTPSETAASQNSAATHDQTTDAGEDNLNGDGLEEQITNRGHTNGQHLASHSQGLGIIVQLSPDDADKNGRAAVLEGSKVKAALAELAEDASRRPSDDKEKILKLSPDKIQELTSSPESIPYRTATPETNGGQRVVSDHFHSNGTLRPEIRESILQSLSETPPLEDSLKARNAKSSAMEEASLPASPALPRPSLNGSVRNRPYTSRTFSTPGLSRHSILPTNNERLAQTWASRSKQDRNAPDRDLKTHLAASPQIIETPIPSPLPVSIPIPPVSIPTYLQLELASGRPSPLYIHRPATNDFPYESSSAKIERLMNFLILPGALEQVLCFGSLACLDSWLYSFTILPLRFIKAVYILSESWAKNLNAEFWFIWKFVVNGVGRVWRRRNHDSERHESEPDVTPRLPNGSSTTQDATTSLDRDPRLREPEPSKRRHRASESRRHHRRKKSMPSALLPDDKADILTGLLMVATCWALMYFDASRMYHWIRGQAAIKLYVIYNVLEVLDRLLAAIGQDVLECLFSREALERRPDGRSKILRPFGLFLAALVYTVAHATSLFSQVMTLNVAVNSYSNALMTLLLSNQFVEIKSTVFRKFEKENLFQLTCADVVERFQLWLMLTIIASRNIVETGAFNFIGDLGLGSGFSSQASTSTNSTPLSTPPRSASSILPQSFTFFPSSILSSVSSVNSFLPTLGQVLGPFLVVLGSEMLVDWLKHAYINKFNNYRPALYGRYLDVLAKDYYTNAFGDQNLTRRLGLPVIPLSCLFIRVSVQTYQMFLASLLPQHPSSTALRSTSLSSIHNHYAPAPLPSTPPLTMSNVIPVSVAHVSAFFSALMDNAMPSPAQSVQIFTVILLLTAYIVLLILKLLLGMSLLAFARSRYKKMKGLESESRKASSSHPPTTENTVRKDEFNVEGSRRAGGWGMVEVGDEKRRWIYGDDPEGLRRVKEKEDKDKNKDKDLKIDHVQRYEMVAKKIW
ncbi:uncharacterized protein N7473_002855 [Penicillium subrubescens]|uniref:Endoplasmic reticulum membrane protein 65 n=1 Tax=Penicillium subrubescens TaxID=1316194 RepID=A0A1Q5TD96_9EURO|nr:uncharacterized protein N7473_002855 [Penicillium subrubescens]KAJ5905939.1 hypothetical protein N7473_002855 [Penicillium subrubescens]OKO98194.1 Endoplasmic reticulum membrane protein 65 [Penicillium subrubescens]